MQEQFFSAHSIFDYAKCMWYETLAITRFERAGIHTLGNFDMRLIYGILPPSEIK